MANQTQSNTALILIILTLVTYIGFSEYKKRNQPEVEAQEVSSYDLRLEEMRAEYQQEETKSLSDKHGYVPVIINGLAKGTWSVTKALFGKLD